MLVLSFFLIILTQCEIFERKIQNKNSSISPEHQPMHLGEGKKGSYQLFDFIVFKNSVSIRATSPDISVIASEVYDTDKDGDLDSVYILKNGNWIFFTLLNKNEDSDEKTSTLCNYIGLANHARNITK